MAPRYLRLSAAPAVSAVMFPRDRDRARDAGALLTRTIEEHEAQRFRSRVMAGAAFAVCVVGIVAFVVLVFLLAYTTP